MSNSEASNSQIIAFMGASRGLGAAVVRAFENEVQVVRFARKVNLSVAVPPSLTANPTIIEVQADFSREDQWLQIFQTLIEYKVNKVFYFAGGGPYAHFPEAQWSSQLWSHRVSFLFPAFLIHSGLKHFQQMIFTGSSIAEASGDPNAAMYSASKHALKGLIDSIQLELKNRDGSYDLRLFSPGYIDTDLLPKNSWPRTSAPAGSRISSPDEVAQLFYEFANSKELLNQNLILPAFQSKQG